MVVWKRGSAFCRRIPASGPPPMTDFRWVVADFSDDPGSHENSFMCHSFMCLFGALEIKYGHRARSGAGVEMGTENRPKTRSRIDPFILPKVCPVKPFRGYFLVRATHSPALGGSPAKAPDDASTDTPDKAGRCALSQVVYGREARSGAGVEIGARRSRLLGFGRKRVVYTVSRPKSVVRRPLRGPGLPI